MAQYLDCTTFKPFKQFIMKIYFLKPCFVLLATMFLFSCGNNTSSTEKSTTDTTTADTDANMAPNPNATMPDSNNNKMDVSVLPPGTANEFVTKAGEGGFMEVAMGKLAQSNGGSNDVKEYGKMLETDHGNANNKLKEIAAAEKISMPVAATKEQTMHVNEMQSKTGADFDKMFIPMMIEDHEKDISEFKKAATDNSNAKVKDFAAKTLPTLKKHLDRAKMIKSKMK